MRYQTLLEGLCVSLGFCIIIKQVVAVIQMKEATEWDKGYSTTLAG